MKRAFLVGLLLAIAAPVLAEGNNSTATNATSTNASTNGTTTSPSNQSAAPIEFTLEGHQDNDGLYWTLAGKTEKNPTLSVQPGQHVTFHLKSTTGLHNFKVADLKATPPFGEGDTVPDVAWTAPATVGSVTYICAIHGTVMSGKILVGSAPSAGGSDAGGAGNITGATIDLGDVGYPQCAGVKVPAIVEKHVTGGPTLGDYAANCHGGAASAGRPSSQADLVIPVSIGLIGLGIVGMVWVHRAYKP